jgi:sugar lactone lactonase YvrE
VFADTSRRPGVSDGSTIDAEGCLWNARWNGWQLVRYAPESTMGRTIPLPVQYPTSCTFGGPNCATLYVKSAVWDLSEEQIAAQPLAGGVPALEPGVCGGSEPWFSQSEIIHET